MGASPRMVLACSLPYTLELANIQCNKEKIKQRKMVIIQALKAANQECKHTKESEVNKCLFCNELWQDSNVPILETIKIIQSLENSNKVNAGRGSFLNEKGEIETESLIATTEPSLALSAFCSSQYLFPAHLLHFEEILKDDLYPAFLSKPRFEGGVPFLIPSPDKKRKKKWKMKEEILKDLKTPYAQVLELSDTVGVCTINCRGNAAVASSSGGPWCHKERRIGMVSSFGSGSYVETSILQFPDTEDKRSCKLTIALTISGDGNEILRRAVAMKIYHSYLGCFKILMQTKPLVDLLNDKTVSCQSIMEQSKTPTCKIFNDEIKVLVEELSFGCIMTVSLKLDQENEKEGDCNVGYELTVIHTTVTPNFVYGYKFPNDAKPKIMTNSMSKGGDVKIKTIYPK
ncbi:unnamed protein product [Moneuplotes crassus]|uniref:Uncharacterized protein n=1 Tax=Euplotes crassus TaxID=5936 RepID=A0AAD1X5B9_EUPCR|nr:unnamed protein product [Moneuplotes crassus]